jgi:DNA polymerase III alpha subunit
LNFGLGVDFFKMENKQEIVPIFYDHSSYKSILTFWTGKDCIAGGPDSIIDLAKSAGLKKIFFVSSNFRNFDEAIKSCEKSDIQLCFGLELWITDRIERNDQSSHNESKIIIWMKNSRGYRDLIKIYSEIFTNNVNKYYHYRGDWATICRLWTDNLILSIPFMDSFIQRNLLHYGSSIIPTLPCNPILHREVDSGLPFDGLINAALDEYNKDQKLSEIKTKTIMYSKREDARAYCNYRAILNKGDFGNPKLDFLCSDNFCFDDYLEVSK